MPRAKLDHLYCLTAGCEPGKKKTDHWDTHIPGFVLEARCSGGKTYALRYTDERGRQRQHRIGRWDVISNEQARKAATRLRAEVELGGNPQVKKERVKAVPDYAALADQHLAFARSYLKTPDNVEAVLRVHILPRWGKVRVDEMSAQAIAKWLAELRERYAPATVEKIRITLNRSFELALKWDTPGVVKNPVRHIPRPKYNNSRERYLTEKEAARLQRAVANSANPQLKFIVGLLLLTGARKTELLRAKWEHVDLDRRSWHIPTTKTGKPRHVPLSQAAVDIIERLARWHNCPWLLPNPDTRLPYTDIKRVWDTARDEAGLHGLRLHDLRHSAASFMINAGIDLYAVGRILGHADHQSTQRYSHLANDTLMRAVEAGAAKINVDWAGS
jgi:integrase